MKFGLTISLVPSGEFTPHTGLQQSDITFVRADNPSTVVTYSSFTEIGNGQYTFDNFNVPLVSLDTGTGQWTEAVVNVLVKINGVLQPGFGEIPVANIAYRNVNSGDMGQRLDRLGDTQFGYITYDISLSGWNGFNPLNPPVDAYLPMRILPQGYFASRFATTGSLTASIASTAALTGLYVTLGTTQAIVGAKTWSGTQVWDIGASTTASPKWQIQMASNPINGGVIGAVAGYQSNNKMLFNFMNSDMLFNGGITASGTAMLSNPKIPTTSSKYIGNNYEANDYIPKKYVTDNFTPLGSGYQSNTVVIDKMVTTNVTGKLYSTINAAITDLTGSAADDSIYTLLIKEDVNENGYIENINLPQWFNMIGEGQVKIFGQFSRAGSPDHINCKLENIHFIQADISHAVSYVEAVDCIFSTVDSNDSDSIGLTDSLEDLIAADAIVPGGGGGGQVVLDNSIVRNCAFFGYYASGAGVISNGNNQVFNCNSNVNVTWNSLTDNVFSFSSLSGTVYSV